MSDYIWETFDGLFKTVQRQGLHLEKLEVRIVELERRLSDRSSTNDVATADTPAAAIHQMPVDRAA